MDDNGEEIVMVPITVPASAGPFDDKKYVSNDFCYLAEATLHRFPHLQRGDVDFGPDEVKWLCVGDRMRRFIGGYSWEIAASLNAGHDHTVQLPVPRKVLLAGK